VRKQAGQQQPKGVPFIAKKNIFFIQRVEMVRCAFALLLLMNWAGVLLSATLL